MFRVGFIVIFAFEVRFLGLLAEFVSFQAANLLFLPLIVKFFVLKRHSRLFDR